MFDTITSNLASSFATEHPVIGCNLNSSKMIKAFCFMLYLAVKVGADCEDGTTSLTAVTNNPGHVTYPTGREDYASNVNKCWRITSDVPGQGVLVGISVSQIGNGDAIRVYNSVGGNDTSEQLFTKTNAAEFSESIVATSGSAFIQFSSDATSNAGNDKGFTIFYVTGTGTACGASIPAASKETRYLTSPNFPNTYDLSSKCSWTIGVEKEGSTIDIELKYFDMEYQPQCEYDYFQIVDDSDDGTTSDKICGNEWYPSFTYSSGGSELTITMGSDSVVNKNGFIISYKQTEGTVDITLMIVSVVLTSLSLIGCIFGSLYCVDKL